MHKLLSLLLLAAVTLSGCASEAPETTEPTQEPASEGPSEPAPSEPGPSEPAPSGPVNVTNTVPTASLRADVVEGIAPLNVTFTIDGDDEDGDALAWTLFVGDEEIAAGDELPATTHHVFDVGNHTVLLRVSDAEDEATDSVAIAVGALEPEVVTFSGEIVGMGLGCADPNDAQTIILSGAHDFDITSDLWGMEYTLEPAGARVSWWLGEELDDPIEAGGNAGTVPIDTTSGHVCFDETADLLSVGTPTEWTLTILKFPQ